MTERKRASAVPRGARRVPWAGEGAHLKRPVRGAPANRCRAAQAPPPNAPRRPPLGSPLRFPARPARPRRRDAPPGIQPSPLSPRGAPSNRRRLVPPPARQITVRVKGLCRRVDLGAGCRGVDGRAERPAAEVGAAVVPDGRGSRGRQADGRGDGEQGEHGAAAGGGRVCPCGQATACSWSTIRFQI